MQKATLLSILVLTGAAVARAEPTPVPYVLTSQGRLLGDGDTPAQGDKLVKFQIHTSDNQAVNDPKWTEEKTITFDKGLYSTVLGDDRPGRGGKALDLSLLAEPELYVSLVIDGRELLPRMRIPSAPYALRAARAAETEKVLANGVNTAAIQDKAVTLAKLDPNLKNVDGKLDADTLDGKDSSAFAPAGIESKIDAINGKVDQGLSNLSGIQTDLGSTLSKVNGLGTSVDTAVAQTDTVKASLAAITTKLNDTYIKARDAQDAAAEIRDTFATTSFPSSTNLWKELQTIRVKAERKYSRTCKNATDAWVTETYTSDDLCLRDGRWHEVYRNKGTTVQYGTVALLKQYVQEGASLRVTFDEQPNDWGMEITCPMVSVLNTDAGVLQCGAERRDDAIGATSMEFITVDTQGRHTSSAGAFAVPNTGWTLRWWVKY